MIPVAAAGQNVGMAMHEVPVDLTNATVMAPSLDDGTAGWATPGRIPEAAVEAAVEAHCEGTMLAALEAAYPILLSHEREETRLTHIDAVVNRDTADKLQAKLDRVEALHTVEHVDVPLWQSGYKSGGDKCALDGQRWPCETIAAITEAEL